MRFNIGKYRKKNRLAGVKGTSEHSLAIDNIFVEEI